MRPRNLLLAGTLCWVAMTACPAGVPPEDPEIVVGVIIPLSGRFAATGRATEQGISLAAAAIHPEGVTVGGVRHQIRYIVEDDEGRPETAVSKALKLVNSDGAVVLVGLPSSSEAVAVARVAEELRVPMLSTQATHADVTRGRRYSFRLMFNDELQGRLLARFAVHDLGARSAAVLADSGSVYSLGLAETFRRAFAEEGGTITAFETFTEDERESTSQLLRIRESRPDVFLLPTHSGHVRPLLQQVRAAEIEATLLGGDAWGIVDFDEDSERDTAFFTAVWAPDVPTEASRQFVASFREFHGETPAAVSAIAYDALSIVAEALRDQEEVGAETVRRGLSSLGEWQGVTGKIRFEASGDPLRSAILVRLESDGELRFHQHIDSFDPGS